MEQETNRSSEFTETGDRYQAPSRKIGLKYGIIEVTSRCQLRCPGCYMVRRDRLNRGQMSFKTAVYILDLCRDYRGGQDLETMDILGGDPLLWPFLKDYVSELLRRGIKPWIFSNLLAISPESAKWLWEREVNITGKLNINPQAAGQLNKQAEMIGRSPRVAKKMLEAIETTRLAGYKAPLLRLQNLVRRSNLELIPDYYRWCLENEVGVDLELMGSGEPITEEYWRLAPGPEEIAGLITKIQAVRAEYGLPPAEVLMPHLFGSCPFYDAGLYFDVAGGIRACSNSTVSLGSIFNLDPIAAAYGSELICRRLKLSKELIGAPCNACAKWTKCRGGCRATAEGTTGSFGAYPLCPVPFL